MSAEPPRPPVPPTEPTEQLREPLPPRAPRQPVARESVVERDPAYAPPPPEGPLPEDRWGNPWAALLAGLAGVAVGVIVGLAVSGDNGKTVTETVAGGQPALTRTVTQTQTQTQPTVEVRTNTVTAPPSAE